MVLETLQVAVGELVVRAGSRQDVERFGGVALSAVADGGVDGYHGAVGGDVAFTGQALMVG